MVRGHSSADQSPVCAPGEGGLIRSGAPSTQASLELRVYVSSSLFKEHGVDDFVLTVPSAMMRAPSDESVQMVGVAPPWRG
jgi:hypothetical protein